MGLFTMTNEQYTCCGGGRDTFICRASAVIHGTGKEKLRSLPSDVVSRRRRYTGHISSEGNSSSRIMQATGHTPRDCSTVTNNCETTSQTYGAYFRQGEEQPQ